MRVTKKIKQEQLAILERLYRGAKPELIFRNAFELLIAVILSAQCTDKRVNVTTARLFQKAATPEAILSLGLAQLEEEIRDCGLFRNKAKNILAACQMLCEQYGGEVPADFEALQSLPGVGRKTANVVMSVAFHQPAIAVDTHVFRIANRLKLATGKTPLEVEHGLQKAIPREKWSDAHHWLIWHGRKICKARKPLCTECPLAPVCPSSEPA
ncbi:DNA-(apurinic or apyrimidinic site) lyase /endonuclease III [Selenomonas ruminantium]|uniref:Endonuclease III n=1 Tax=Selenomonas ruminantium TaxID=971 RepID=A0A1I3GZ47_SELRU|nr:endonuclease III [Selenomonas ruminantium]SFI28560.1 DNA-(apurinic or apyrimidinic site) lyase /endonuclease III [Selenomonas ruminantium]